MKSGKIQITEGTELPDPKSEHLGLLEVDILKRYTQDNSWSEQGRTSTNVPENKKTNDDV